MVRNLLLALLVACGGPVEETLVDELRVVAAIPSAPEARPGESVDVAVTVVEPEGLPVDVLVWLCTAAGPPGAPCAESAGELAATAVVQRGAVSETAVSLQVPALLSGVLSDDLPEIRTSLWVLACEAGLCPLIDEVAAAPAAGTDAHADVAAQLADPASVLADLPLQGVAASRRTLRVSNRTDDVRNRNPTLTGVLDIATVAPGGELAVSLTVEDDQPGGTAFGYATAGGFGVASALAIEGQVDLDWLAPEESITAPVQLMVVVQDGLGGEALWRGSVRVGE
jgi:hypothetical protein